MDLHTIDMDRAEARKLYIEYRDAVRARADAEMAEMMRGYRELAKGHQLIDLAATVRQGGVVEVKTRRWRGATVEVYEAPRIACMRASERWCYVRRDHEGAVTFSAVQQPAHNATRNVINLPAGTLPEGRSSFSSAFAKAMVPPVPPRYLPAHGLDNYHVLWEAEWTPEPPVDPALLRHIGGDLYAVLATWDLTELERTVLARRFR